MALLRPVILALVLAGALASPAAAQAAPTLSVDDPADTVEGDTGSTGTASFKVTLTEAPLLPVTVNYTTVDGSAKQPGDYEERTGTLTFGLLDPLVQTVEVPVQGDALDEEDETFKLKATSPLIADAEGTGTITDDDDPPSLTISNTIVREGSSGTPNAVFGVSLSAPSGKPISVGYTTQNGSAQQPGDYIKTSSPPPVTFAPDETKKTVAVPVVPDPFDEPTETFRLVPNNPQAATLAAGEEGVAFIIDRDFPFSFLPPIARIDVNPPRAYVGRVVEFNGSRSTSVPPGRSLQYRWDLDGNGSFETPTGTESAIGLAFFGPGRQFVGLRVTETGPGGRSDSEGASAEIFPAPPEVAPDTTPPATKLFSGRRSLARALRRGIRVRFGCSEACLIAATAGVDRRTGRIVGLSGRRRTMGRASSAMPKAGSKVLTFKLSRQARRRLAEVEKVRVNLRFKVRDAALNARTVNYKITLRR